MSAAGAQLRVMPSHPRAREAQLAVHLLALTGFQNRATVLFNWAIAFLGRGHPQRAITTQQVFARRVREEQAARRTRVTIANASTR
jgi:hypothetical protein